MHRHIVCFNDNMKYTVRTLIHFYGTKMRLKLKADFDYIIVGIVLFTLGVTVGMLIAFATSGHTVVIDNFLGHNQLKLIKMWHY